MTLFFSLLISFLAVRGFRFEFTRTGLVLRNTESFVWLLLMLFFCRICLKSLEEPDRRLKKYALLYGLVIAVFTILGKILSTLEYFAWIWENPHNLIHFLNMLLSYWLLYYSFAFLAFGFLKRYREKKTPVAASPFSMKKVLLVWMFLLIFYVPWWMYNFPGIVSPDSGTQIRDALTTNTLSDWNPAFVTLLIRAVMVPVIRMTGSINTAVGVCTFLQMMILTFVFALAFERICRHLHNKTVQVLIFLFYAVYPVNNIFSVTMWKDILFSAFFLGFLLCLDDCTENEEAFFSNKGKCLLLFLTMLLMPLLRHNGLFITVIVSIYLSFRFKRFRKIAAVLSCSVLILMAVWKLLILPGITTEPIPSGEYLSVPLQQVTRVLVKRYEDLSPETREEIQGWFTVPDIRTEYAEKTVDPVKKHFNSELFEKNRWSFFSLWFRLSQKYPVEYLEGFLHNNYGYWYPETSWWITMSGIQMHDRIPELQHTPILKLGIVDKINQWFTSEQYEKTPVLPLLFKPGACFWGWLFFGIFCLYQNRKKFVLFISGFLLWFIILWSAVYCEYRYVYALFICLPMFSAAALTRRRKE